MKKVSFDFDSTLDRLDAQEYAKELVNRGIEVWICTSRYSDKNNKNEDLHKIATEVGIKKEHIHFQEMQDKYFFFIDKDFIWHLDDDWIELKLIIHNTKTKGISIFGQSNWKKKCEKLLN